MLDRALAAVERGPSRAVGLRGEPGIGKSRLLAELASRAEKRSHLVLAGRATELERDLPFALLIDAFDRRLASDPPAGLTTSTSRSWPPCFRRSRGCPA